MIRRDAPARWTTGLHRFERATVDDAAADVEHDLAEGDAQRHLDKTGVDHPAGEGEDLGPGARRPPDAGVPGATVADDRGDVGKRLDVVDQRRLLPQTGHGRVRRAWSRCAPAAFHGSDQGGFLATHESACPDADLDVEAEPGLGDGGAEEVVPLGLTDRAAQTLDSKGVFGADVDVAALGPDRVAGNGHPLEHPLRIALQHAAVHERPGVAFVGIAHHVLAGSGGLGDG